MKPCACGCGRAFTPNKYAKNRQRYASARCESRVNSAAYYRAHPEISVSRHVKIDPYEVECACGCGVIFWRGLIGGGSWQRIYATKRCAKRGVRRA